MRCTRRDQRETVPAEVRGSCLQRSTGTRGKGSYALSAAARPRADRTGRPRPVWAPPGHGLRRRGQSKLPNAPHLRRPLHSALRQRPQGSTSLPHLSGAGLTTVVRLLFWRAGLNESRHKARRKRRQRLLDGLALVAVPLTLALAVWVAVLS